jgi:hypothetical protein
VHNYESAHGSLPPVAVTDESGNPLLSWRVLLLPYIAEKPLYEEFRLDEPWDSPHNVKLLDRMPATYKSVRRRMNPAPNHTYIHVFTGPNTPFELGKRVRLVDFERGSANTIMIVEGGEPVPWTKPADIYADPNGPLPEVPGLWPDLIRTAYADGSVQYFKPPNFEPFGDYRPNIALR